MGRQNGAAASAGEPASRSQEVFICTLPAPCKSLQGNGICMRFSLADPKLVAFLITCIYIALKVPGQLGA